MDSTARLAQIVRDGVAGAPVPLDEAALLIAAHDRPGLDVAAEMHRLDEIAAEVSEPTLDGLLRTLFDDRGFAGAVDDYYAPENSFLDQVIARRRGIPITLALVAIEVGRRVGVPLAPVGMPGHFLVRDRVLDDVFVDCFAGGARLDAAGCQAVFRRLHGASAHWDDAYLDEIPALAVLHRILGNLVGIYHHTDDNEGLAWVLALRTDFPGAAIAEHVRLAEALERLGRFDAAATRYAAVAALVDPERAAHYAARARRSASHLN